MIVKDEKALEHFLVNAAEDEEHDVHIKCWQYILFPVWIKKTFMHAKHEAFRFKYDSKSLMEVEKHSMRGIGFAMYALTFIYFCTMFGLPSFFIEGECGDGLGNWVFYTYGI